MSEEWQPGVFFQALDVEPVARRRMEQTRRAGMASQVRSWAMETVKAVDSLRAFDRTGSADLAVDHLVAAAEAALTLAKRLANEVDAATGRYADEQDEPVRSAREVSGAGEHETAPAPVQQPAGRVSPMPGPAGAQAPSSVTPVTVAAQQLRSVPSVPRPVWSTQS